MKARPADAQIQGFFCPLQRPELVARRLRTGKCIRTEVGLEKHCPKCDDYWPMDTEFWFASKTEDGLFAWCRSCYTKHRWPERGAPTPAGPPPEIGMQLQGGYVFSGLAAAPLARAEGSP